MWESNPPGQLFTTCTGFEDREAHQHLSAPMFSLMLTTAEAEQRSGGMSVMKFSIQAAAVQDYQAFYEEEMSYRMLLDYPPAAHMLAVLGSGPEDEKLVQAMYYLKLYIERIYRENDLHIIGPAYASVGKVKDIYRQVIYLKHKDHKTLVHIKDQLEKYIEINSGFRKIYIQFDFS